MASSIGFRMFSFLPSCYSSYGAWTLTPVGLSPTDHASLRWTHTLRYLSNDDDNVRARPVLMLIDSPLVECYIG